MLLSCVHMPPPPHLSPILRDMPHPPAVMVIRTGGTARMLPPPHCYPHPISAVRDLSGGSLWQPLILRLWVCELILDSDGDHFLFSPIFKEIFSEVWEKSAAVDSAEPNSKGILLRLRRRDIFVGARLLSTRDFCGCEILSTQDFCWRKIFVDARILSTPIISVGTNILSPPIFLSVFRLRMII